MNSICEKDLESQLSQNFAKLATLFSYVLWEQQGIYIHPYDSSKDLSKLDQEILRKGIRSVLLSFETLRIQPENYFRLNGATGLLEETVSLKCSYEGPVKNRPVYMTDLLFELEN